jgi:hypothetical protein
MSNRYLRDRAMSRRDSKSGRGRHSDYRSMRNDGMNDYRTRIPSEFMGAYMPNGNLKGHEQLGMYRGRSMEGMRGGRQASGQRDYNNDYGRGPSQNYNYGGYSGHNYGYHNDYNDYGDYRDYRDYNDYNDYNDYRDYNDYNDYGMDEEYKRDLQEWMQKLKRHDKFKLNEQELFEKAKQMGVRFDKYKEDEFMTVFYLTQAMFPNVSNDMHMYLAMAKSALEFKELGVDPEEALCIFMYKIIKGE